MTKKVSFKYKPGDLLVIRWKDAVAVSGWINDEACQTMELEDAVSVGWFINANDGVLRLTTDINNNGKNVNVFPQSWIYKITKVDYDRDS